MGVNYDLMDAKSTIKENPRKNANIFSLLFVWWLKKLLSIGNRRSLENEDLFPLLDDDKTKTSTEKLQMTWAEESTEHIEGRSGNGHRLFRALLRMLSWKDHLFIWGLVILQATFRALRPVCLGLLLLELMKGSYEEVSWAYFYGAEICLSQFGESLCFHQLLYHSALISLRWKSGTIPIVYQRVRNYSNELPNYKMTTFSNLIMSLIDHTCLLNAVEFFDALLRNDASAFRTRSSLIRRRLCTRCCLCV